MPTGYKYVERDAQDTQINWAEVGANFSGMLQEENRVREEKKAAFDKQARDYQNALNEIPTGQNTQLNSAALDFADDLQKQSLMLNKLFKAGQLKQKDYTIQMQNLMDGTNQGFGLFEDYNQEYSKKMKMVEDGTLSQVDLDIMANAESFANFQEHKFLINPETGVVSIGKMIEGPDGTLIPDTNPNNLATVASLRDRIRQTVKRFDVMGVSQQRAKSLGKDERTIIESMGTAYKAGIFKQVSDIRQRERYGDKTDAEYAKELGIKEEDFKSISLFYESQDKWAKSQVSSDVNSMAGASTLVDFITSKGGTQYTTTFDPKGVFNEDGSRDETIILLENKNGRVVSNLTDIQQANAEQALKDQSESMIDTKVTTKPMYTEKPLPVRSGGGGTGTYPKGDKPLSDKQLFGYLKNLWEGTEGQINSAEKRLRGYNPDIVKIDRNDEGVYITYKDEESGKLLREPFDFAKMDTEADWIAGISSFVGGSVVGKDYIKKSLEWSGYGEPQSLKKYGKTFTDQGEVVQQEREKLTRDTFYDKNNQTVLAEIADVVEAQNGDIIKADEIKGFNSFKVKRADGKIAEFNTNQGTVLKARYELNRFYEFIRGGTTEATDAKGTTKATDYIGGLREQYPDLKFETSAGGIVEAFDKDGKAILGRGEYYNNKRQQQRLESKLKPYATTGGVNYKTK